MAPVREECKQDGSLGKLHGHYGEWKTGVVDETWVDPGGKDSRVRTRGYGATPQDVAPFEPLWGLLAHRAGHPAATEVVVGGTGPDGSG